MYFPTFNNNIFITYLIINIICDMKMNLKNVQLCIWPLTHMDPFMWIHCNSLSHLSFLWVEFTLPNLCFCIFLYLNSSFKINNNSAMILTAKKNCTWAVSMLSFYVTTWIFYLDLVFWSSKWKFSLINEIFYWIWL